MQPDTEIAAASPSDEPVGNPPAGGSWEWKAGAWARRDVEQTLHDEPTDQPAAQE